MAKPLLLPRRADRAQVAVQPIERLPGDLLQARRDVPAFEDVMALRILGQREEAEQRLLRSIEGENEVVASVDHQDRDTNAWGEVERVDLGGILLRAEASTHEDQGAETGFDGPHDGTELGTHAQAVESE